MAEKELSILVRARGAAQAVRDIGRVDSSIGRLSQHATQGLRTGVTNIAKIGAIAAGGIALAVHSGIESLATLEDGITSVNAAAANAGLKGKVSGAQVATWANQIESAIGAAFDDKDIVTATATLIRFGKVTPTNLRPAMQVITDLATKTGSVESAATLLAKALADPTKAAGKLARSGVILTKQEQKQITTLVKSGKTAQAQKIILDSLTRTTKGAAAASQGPYRRSLNVLKDVTEDAQRALGEGFLPVIEKVSTLLSGELAKPSTINGIRAFGQELAGGLDSLIGIAKNLPWSTIGDSLRIGGSGARAILDAFVGMPPWVQTAILTSWGLNKLTGGALGGIAGELGKGLIKGVLGMNAGVVNIKAGTVVGAGGGGPVSGGKGGGLASGIAKVFLVGAAAGVAAELWQIRSQQSDANQQQARDLTAQTGAFVKVAGVPEMQRALAGILETDKRLSTSNDILNAEVVAFQMNIDGVRDAVRTQETALKVAIAHQTDGNQSTIERMRGSFTSAVSTSGAKTAAAARAAGIQAAAAIRDKDLSVAVKTAIGIRATVNVSSRAAGHAILTDSIRTNFSGTADPRAGL